jgi:Uma2 family endonuclease
MAEPAYPLRFRVNDGKNWPAQGAWTYEDYLRLPADGRRYEVLRGALYVTPAPIYDHQFSVIRLGYYLTHLILEKDLGVLLTAPFDIRLPHQLADPVEPDLVFFRKGNGPRSGDKSFTGVPDLVIEVLSPGTHKTDARIKLAIYRQAGIPEYWLVNPKTRRILIHRLSPEGEYVEWAHSGEGEVVSSETLPGLSLAVSSIFPQ